MTRMCVFVSVRRQTDPLYAAAMARGVPVVTLYWVAQAVEEVRATCGDTPGCTCGFVEEGFVMVSSEGPCEAAFVRLSLHVAASDGRGTDACESTSAVV